MRTTAKFLIGISLVTLSVALLAAGPSRKSSDGAAYPEVEGKDVPIAALPLIGKAIGLPPEKAFKTVISNTKLTPSEISNALETEWYTRSTYANGVGFDMTDGRITKIVLLFKDLSSAREETILSGYKRLSPDHKSLQGIKVGGIAVHIWLVRGHPAPYQQEVHSPDARLFIELDPAEWYLSTHDVNDGVVKAITEKRVVKGMTEREARLAMRDYKVKVTEADGVKTLNFYMLGFQHTGVVGGFQTEHFIASATIENGMVTSTLKTEE